MDAKDLRIETALSAHSNDGSTKYGQSGTALQSSGNKPYHKIGSNALAKVDIPTARPCAIIGPDRVVPPLSTSDAYLKKIPVDPWPCTDNIYMHPEYPHKPVHLPPRNISPRQTFQENMQRIMVPPTYASARSNEENSLKNSKIMPPEAKYCDVPYTISPINNEPKITKSSEGLVLNNNPSYTKHLPPNGWAGSSVNVRPLRSYGASEFYQYSEYPNCPGPRPISMIRPHRNVHEDVPQVYQDRFYAEANIRFKPYPTAKERTHQLPQARYDYIANYPNTFHLHPPYPPHKYDLQKSMQPIPCPVYQPVPLKYLDRRMPAPNMDRYQRSPTQQMNFNPQFCNQNIPPNYGSVPGNSLPNRAYPYMQDPSTKPLIQNRVYFDSHNTRKYYPNSENMYLNDVNQLQAIKNDVMYQSYPPMNIQSLSPHPMYRKEIPIKGYEQSNHFRNIEYSANMNPLSRLPLQFSPQTISISPDSNTSNDTAQILSNVQEDCGYVSQSSTASVKSMESGVNRLLNDMYQKHDIRYETFPRIDLSGRKLDTKSISKDKKELNVRQFLQMWNEGDEFNDNSKESSIKKDSTDSIGTNQINNCDNAKNQEPLYVLDLVNVPSEELCKYDHIQKISKLPENIKGYNNIELLNQYEKLVESPNINHFNLTQPTKQKDLVRPYMPRPGMGVQPRPISPLDVEAKISQSVIHKEVGCNFEIRPCSPQMLNVEVATPIHNVLGERLIEKVVNPNVAKSPMLHRRDDTNIDTLRNSPKVQSCKLVNNQYPSPNISDTLKPNYCLQDLESNSGICLASLPRLDNDIELNFPEINQQFINANKINPTKTSSLRDLPSLEPDIGGNVKANNRILTPEHLNSGSESDREVSKLSKYRKFKKNCSTIEANNESDVNSSQHMSINRTDSVIIKNPENIKSHADYVNTSLNNFNSPRVNTTKPINISEEVASTNFEQSFDETMNEKFNYFISTDISDTAIDFSINKNDEQGDYINSLNNLSDSLQDKIDTSPNIFARKETNTCDENNVTNVKSPEKLSKTSPTDFNVTQTISPMFDHFACSDNSNNNILTEKTHNLKEINTDALEDKLNFKCPDEDNLLDKTVITNENCEEKIMSSISPLAAEEIIPCHDTENTLKNLESSEQLNNGEFSDTIHLKSNNKDDVLETTLASCHANPIEILNGTSTVSKLENIIPQNNFPISSNNTENVVTNLNFGDNVASVNSALSNDIENQILSKYLIEEPNHLNTPVQDQLESNSEEIGSIDQDNVMKVGNKFATTVDAVDKIDGFDSNKNLLLSCENESFLKSEVQGCLNDETKNMTVMLEVNLEREKDSTDIKTFIPSFCKDEDSNSNDLKNVCDTYNNHEKDVTENLENIPGEDITDGKNLNNHIIISEQPNKENNNTITITNLASTDDLESEVINIRNNSELNCKVNDNNPAMIFQTINKFFFGKELFSPWIQKLLINNDGFCTQKDHNGSFLNNDSSQLTHNQLVENSTFDQELKFVDNIKNDKKHENLNENTSEIKLDSEQCKNYKVQENIVQIKPNKMCHNETLLEYESSIDIDPKNLNNNENLLDCEIHESKIDIESNNMNRNETLLDCETQENKIIIEENNVDRNEILLDANSEANFIEENNTSESLSTILEHEINEIETESNIEIKDNLNNIVTEIPSLTEQPFRNQWSIRRSRTLKRSFSESAITEYTNVADSYKNSNENSFMIPNKRSKVEDSEMLVESHMIAQNFTSFIQNNRRNSISTIYNDENVSFCIVIDNDCVIADENENSENICYTEINNDCLATLCSDADAELANVITSDSPQQFSDEFILQNVDTSKSIEETWIDDVACMETVFSDDIAEDIVISALSSPKDTSASSENESEDNDSVYKVSENEHANKIKHIYGNKMCEDDAQLVEKLYRTPQMDVNKTLIDRESQHADEYHRYYDTEALEQILSDSNIAYDMFPLTENNTILDETLELPNSNDFPGIEQNFNPDRGTMDSPKLVQTEQIEPQKTKLSEDSNVHFFESSHNNIIYQKEKEEVNYATSSSPEVSSTTSEDKNSTILLKIRSYKGTKISEINEMGSSFRQTQSQIYNDSSYSTCKSRPLITKAAQKYIPPLKETIRDLKVKLHLPKQSLYKLQQLKKSKEEPKINANNKHYGNSVQQQSLKKKLKPKFEDVLKSIDEIQFQKHKEKHKKTRQSVPKVIIKKAQNGAHYASTTTSHIKETYNPDLTGRKWQPWVFLEKSIFIDKMAVKQKFKAIYSHRKKTYVLAESFRKYKSISSSKFVISPPKSDNLSSGKLKYTFKLKHD